MRKSLLILALVALVLNAQAVIKVAYVTLNKTLFAGNTTYAAATTVQNDPVIQMLKNDANITLTVKVIASTDVISDLADYDVIIVQETIGGGDAVLKPTGSLALKSIPKPFIYNKVYSLKQTRAITTGTTVGGKESGSALSITVQPTALTNDLFKACTFSGTNNDQIALFNALSTDLGEIGATGSTKAINYASGSVVTPSTTILALPSVMNSDGSTASVCFNYIPSGSSIDSEVLISNSFFFGMNSGAIVANGGKNITDDALTMWRNAVYILAGQTVPATKPLITTGFNQPNASTFSFDGKVVRNTNSEVLNVFNVTGKLISTSNKDIDMSNLAKGVYFVKGQNNTLKVSVQ